MEMGILEMGIKGAMYTLYMKRSTMNFNSTLKGMNSVHTVNYISGISAKRYYSSNNLCSSSNNYCSLKILTHFIEDTYNSIIIKNPELEFLLSIQDMRDINNKIMEGKYTFSPLRARLFDKTNENEILDNFILELNVLSKHYINSKKDTFLGIYPTLGDTFVLIGLGRMLNQHIMKKNLFIDSSMGLQVHPKFYWDKVSTKGPVLRLSKLDLTNSMKIINRCNLLSKLSHIVMNGEIMSLIEKYLYLPIMLDENSSIDLTKNINCNIPTAGLISSVLLNFELIELDKEFRRVFPQLDYLRYIHEVLVFFPSTELSIISFDIFREKLLDLFRKLNLEGKIIPIEQGSPFVPCYYGSISLSRDGEILMTEPL